MAVTSTSLSPMVHWCSIPALARTFWIQLKENLLSPYFLMSHNRCKRKKTFFVYVYNLPPSHLTDLAILQGRCRRRLFFKKREKEKWRITFTRIIIQPQLSSLAGKKLREPFKLSYPLTIDPAVPGGPGGPGWPWAPCTTNWKKKTFH